MKFKHTHGLNRNTLQSKATIFHRQEICQRKCNVLKDYNNIKFYKKNYLFEPPLTSLIVGNNQ